MFEFYKASIFLPAVYFNIWEFSIFILKLATKNEKLETVFLFTPTLSNDRIPSVLKV